MPSYESESPDLEQIVKRTAMILADDTNKKAGEKAMSDLKIKTWVMESHKLAKEFAYSKEMLKIVEMGELTAPKALPPIDLSQIDGYQEAAQKIANRRVVEAGYRLAEMLKAVN